MTDSVQIRANSCYFRENGSIPKKREINSELIPDNKESTIQLPKNGKKSIFDSQESESTQP